MPSEHREQQLQSAALLGLILLTVWYHPATIPVRYPVRIPLVVLPAMSITQLKIATIQVPSMQAFIRLVVLSVTLKAVHCQNATIQVQ